MQAYQLSVAYKNSDGQRITSDLITSDFEIKTEQYDDHLKMTLLRRFTIKHAVRLCVRRWTLFGNALAIS